jgi:integrase
MIKQISIFSEKEKLKFVDEFTSTHGTKFFNESIREREVHLKEETITVKIAPKNVDAYLAILKAFFQQQVMKDHMVKSPALHLKQLKVERKKPDFYTPEELRKFFSMEIQLPYRNLFL